MHRTVKKLFLYLLLPCMIFCGFFLSAAPSSTAFTGFAEDTPAFRGLPVASALESLPRRTIRVGFFAFEGYHMLSDHDVRSGYGYDFLQLLARYTNWKYEYIGHDKSWNEMQQMLADGEIDLLTSAQKTPERESLFAFSRRPIGTSSMILTVKAGDDRFTAGDYSTYEGMRIGLLRGNSRNNTLKSFAHERGFHYTPVFYNTSQELLNALEDGSDIDAITTSNLRAIDNEWILDQFAPSPFYAIVRKGDTALMKDLDAALEQLEIYSPEWRTELFTTYYTPGNASSIAFSPEERAYIQSLHQEHIVIRAAMNPDKSPYSYFDANGLPHGILPEIFAEIARRAGIDYEILPASSQEEYRNLLQSGQADIDLDAYFDYSAAEKKGFELTKPFINLPLGQLSRRNFTGDAKSIALPDPMLVQYLNNTSMILEGKTVQILPSIEACVEAVRNGTCDATYLFTYRAQHTLLSDEKNQLRATALPQIATARCIAVAAKNDYRLLSILNKSVDSTLRSTFPQQVLLRYVSDMPQPQFSLRRYLYANPAAATACAVLIILLIAGWIISAQRIRAARMERRHLLEIERQRQALKDALETARHASEAKGNFLSRMSHEIRTPLNAIIGYITLARMPDTTKENMQHYLQSSETASHHLLQIINDILDISAIESGRFQIASEPFHMQEQLQPVVMIFKEQARAKKIRFVTELQAMQPDFFIGDRLRINQILMNLLSNAIKFTPKGGTVTLSMQLAKKADNQALIKFKVIDTGIGMRADYISHIFTPFEQESAKTAQDFGGTGLGLSITQNLVHLMHGSVEVESSPGKGSCFTVSLPLQYAPNEKADEAAPAASHAPLTGMRILLAEDNEMNREIAGALLAESGLTIDTAVNGEEAVDRFIHSEPGTYQCIFMDIQMPVMDGYAATRAIRQSAHPEAASIPIIAVTADVFTEDVARALACGMTDYISKPIDYHKLIDALLRHTAK